MWTGTIINSLRESGKLPEKLTSLMQQVKYSKANPFSFIEISPVVAIFEGNPSVTLFTVCTLTCWKENFAWLLRSGLILIKLG